MGLLPVENGSSGAKTSLQLLTLSAEKNTLSEHFRVRVISFLVNYGVYYCN